MRWGLLPSLNWGGLSPGVARVGLFLLLVGAVFTPAVAGGR